MVPPQVPLIHEIATLEEASPELMDALWALGWRHFGRDFFRYSVTPDEDGRWLTIQPLRMRLSDFSTNKNQRRVLRRNADCEVKVVPAVVDDEREEMFMKHRARFVANVPESLRVFMPSAEPAALPCECLSVEMRVAGRLIAVSYLDVGRDAVSSVYAMFDPEESWRSPGTFTLLEEIRWAIAQGKQWLYPGYATREPSAYDYKKAFRPLQVFDWQGAWLPLEK